MFFILKPEEKDYRIHSCPRKSLRRKGRCNTIYFPISGLVLEREKWEREGRILKIIYLPWYWLTNLILWAKIGNSRGTLEPVSGCDSAVIWWWTSSTFSQFTVHASNMTWDKKRSLYDFIAQWSFLINNSQSFSII